MFLVGIFSGIVVGYFLSYMILRKSGDSAIEIEMQSKIDTLTNACTFWRLKQETSVSRIKELEGMLVEYNRTKELLHQAQCRITHLRKKQEKAISNTTRRVEEKYRHIHATLLSRLLD
jgi:hypothetical protein